ncbi:unknown [Collinsella sp. CAG:289]|nr:unknown [Collinsella sp. CAG:289]
MGIDILEHASNDARDIGERDLAGILAGNMNSSVERSPKVMGNRSGKACCESRFACTRRADDAEEVAFAYRERNMVQRGHVRLAIRERDVLNVDNRIHNGLSVQEGKHGRCFRSKGARAPMKVSSRRAMRPQVIF